MMEKTFVKNINSNSSVKSQKAHLLCALTARDISQCRRLIATMTAESTCVPGDYFFFEKCLEKIDRYIDGKSLKVAIVSSFAMKAIAPFLSVKLFLAGYKAQKYFCPYRQHEQDLLNETSCLYEFAPDFLLLFLRIQDLVPDIFYKVMNGEVDPDVKTDEIIEQMERLVSRIAINTYGNPPTTLLHAFDYPRLSVRQASTCILGQKAKLFIDKLNFMLREVCTRHSFLKYFDYNYFNYLHGYCRVCDENRWLMTQNPIPPEQFPVLVDEYIRYFRARSGETFKCIAVDADNTLWGGVVAEDGIEGIQIGVEYPGSLFREFQKMLLDYRSKGMILVLISKNNEHDILNVLRNHPGMLLRECDFTTIKANWQSKPDNLLECCADLNIGVDSVVFIDDNPFEQELMRTKLPSVLTLDFPNSPEHYREVLFATHILEKDDITEEDRRRGDLYTSEFKRKSFQKAAGSLEEFYRGLEMRAEIRFADHFTFSRAANLTRRTNQFNLTTKRYSVEEIERFASSGRHDLYTLRLIDRFGDNGMVGLCIIEKHQGCEEWSVDTFLLSCRVLGRLVEDVFFSYVLERAQKQNVRRIVGNYVATERNAMVRNFFEKFGFIRDVANQDCGTTERWISVIDDIKLLKHPWLEVIFEI